MNQQYTTSSVFKEPTFKEASLTIPKGPRRAVHQRGGRSSLSPKVRKKRLKSKKK
jgi:hypothetical protein